MIEEVILRLIAQGVSQTSAGVNQVATATQNLGQNAGTATGAVADLGQGLGDVGASAGDATRGLEGAAGGAEDVTQNAGTASTAVSGLSSALEKTRNAGLAMAAIGAGGLAITTSMIAGAMEGNGLETRLESILETQGRLQDLGSINDAIGDTTAKGHFDDDDGLRDAAIHLASFGVESKAIGDLLPRVARQVRTGFGDLTSVADGLGKAYSALDVAPLSRSGLVFTDLEKSSLEAAKGISEAAGKAKFMEVVLAAIDRNTVTLEGSLSQAEQAANDLANAMDGATTQIGSGAADAKMHVDGVLASIIGVINESPDLEYAAGYFGYFASGGLAATGSLLAVGSQIGMTILGLQSMGITSVASFNAWRLSAIGAGTATWAAIAPLLPLLLAAVIATAALAAAFYYLSGAAAEMDALNENIAVGDEASVKLLEIENKSRAKKGLSALTMEQFQGDPDADDKSKSTTGAPPDLGALKDQIAAIQSGAAIPPMPAMVAAPDMAPRPARAIASATTQLPSPVNEKTALDSQAQFLTDPGAFIAKAMMGAALETGQDNKGKSNRSGAVRTGELDLIEVGRSKNAQGEETLDVRGQIKLSGSGSSLNRLKGTL